jgi:hypothetical protein
MPRIYFLALPGFMQTIISFLLKSIEGQFSSVTQSSIWGCGWIAEQKGEKESAGGGDFEEGS